MKLLRLFLLLGVIISLGEFSSGQQFDQDSNWYKEIGKHDDYYSRFDFSRYTEEDVITAKTKYLKISSQAGDEWTGSYRRATMLGHAELTWDHQNGFVYTHIYHTLANLDYGSVQVGRDLVSFIPERETLKSKRFVEGAHIKVKFGERHLLVPKNRIAEFALWAVGREVPSDLREREIYTEEGFFWEKEDDANKELSDIPVFPQDYSHLIRKPITSKVLSVGRLRIKRESSNEGAATSEDHIRALNLSAGSKHGVRIGMRFWVDDLEEWVEVVSVSPERSKAMLTRSFIDGREYCDSYENYRVTEFPCREPKRGMVARTRLDYF